MGDLAEGWQKRATEGLVGAQVREWPKETSESDVMDYANASASAK
jgi:hypothetical protein